MGIIQFDAMKFRHIRNSDNNSHDLFGASEKVITKALRVGTNSSVFLFQGRLYLSVKVTREKEK